MTSSDSTVIALILASLEEGKSFDEIKALYPDQLDVIEDVRMMMGDLRGSAIQEKPDPARLQAVLDDKVSETVTGPQTKRFSLWKTLEARLSSALNTFIMNKRTAGIVVSSFLIVGIGVYSMSQNQLPQEFANDIALLEELANDADTFTSEDILPFDDSFDFLSDIDLVGTTEQTAPTIDTVTLDTMTDEIDDLIADLDFDFDDDFLDVDLSAGMSEF